MKGKRISLSLLLGLGLTLALAGLFAITGRAAPGNPVLDPARNAHTVPTTATVSITYDEAIDAATVTSHTFAVHGMQGGLVAGGHSVNGSVILVDPVGAFFPGELVQASATTGTLNLTGEEPLAPTVWQFRIAVEGGTGRFGLEAHDAFGADDSRAVALGDLDGDGDLDAVMANDGANAIRWLNDGDSTYQSPVPFSGPQAWDVVLGDVDGDGDLDVLLAYDDSSPQEVWLNAGDGTFPISTTLGSSDSHAAALGDVDGDGDLDAVLANNDAPQEAWLNDGSGAFPISTTFGGGDSHDVALGDVDLDGDLDAVVANGSRQAQEVWLNAGDGTFPVSTTFGAGRTQAVALGDLDGDGDLDAALASNNGDPQEAWFNDGSGAFPISTTFGAGTSRDIALGDVDGDGDLDAVVANYNGEAQEAWFNAGDGTYPISRTFGSGDSWDVALGDVDGDGDLDVVVANDNGQAQGVWLNGDAIYVDADATGADDGTSWADAYVHLQDALDEANGYGGAAAPEIWVAEGVYYPDQDSNGDHANDVVSETFRLDYDGIRLYGGFDGTEGAREARDPERHVTVLSGDLDGNDITDSYGVVTDTAHITGANAYHVLWLDGVTNGPIAGDTLIDGFTVTAGYANGSGDHNEGGGLYCDGESFDSECSPSLVHITFSGNWADDTGGGMYNDGQSYGTSNPELSNVTFNSNRASWGGGMFNDGYGSFGNSSPVLKNVTFRENRATYGGGMFNYGSSSPVLTNVTFSGNRANWDGGGMHTFTDGGTSSPVLTNVTFSGNWAGEEGGGMVSATYLPGFSSGGTINPVLTNVTFSGNRAGGNGGAMYNLGYGGTCRPVLTNGVLWGNSASSGDVMYNDDAAPTIAHSLVEGGWDGSGVANDNSTVTDGGGNIDADPQFVAPITATAAPTASGDYRLLGSSPAVDAGNTLSVTATTDRDGHSRLRDGDSDGAATVDMGAYEYQRIYVDAGATSADDGSSWAGAHVHLQDALDEVNGHGGRATCEIWVAEGIYYPDLDTDGDHAADVASEAFTLRYDNVRLYGGFDGAETARDQRDWTANVTILSGDIDGNDVTDGGVVTTASQISGTNAYHVLLLDGVTNEAITPESVIDGFTVTAGQAVGGGLHSYGGGLHCDGRGSGNACNPTLARLAFSGNWAGRGGGMYSAGGDGGASSLALTNVTFRGNWATYGGGGMFNDGSDGGASSPVLANVLFSGNGASVWGGGMFNDGSDGGVSSPVLTNVTLSGNWAAYGGGGMFSDGNSGASSPTLTNVILWGNEARSLDAQSLNVFATPTVNASLVEGGCPTGATCLNLLIADPQFARDPGPGPDALWGTADDDCGDLRLGPGSPALDAGDDSALPLDAADLDGDGVVTETLPCDLAGNPRISNDTVDLGTYETPYSRLYLPLVLRNW